MRTLYLDCGMGAAGDMLAAALLELIPESDKFVDRLNNIGIPSVKFTREPSVKCGIVGTHLSVTVNGSEEGETHHSHGNENHHGHDREHSHGNESEHHHHHASLHDIEHIVRGHMNLSEKIADDVMEVYRLIAEAESHAHGAPVTDIHFHEVGSMDAIADITAVCMLMEELSPDEVVVSPVHVGCGQVRCAHGILPVPAPATAYILKDVPIYGGMIRGELCTPTGAALLKKFATRFGDMPVMRVSAVGYGMGKKDFEAANCVRAMIGERDKALSEVTEFEFNIDDMTAEELAFACDMIFKSGALDVWTTPAVMKKSRLGSVVSVLCRDDARENVLKAIFRHTSTIGVRETKKRRYELERSEVSVRTKEGDEARLKRSTGYGATREKLEYDDLARTACNKDITLSEARRLFKN